MFRKVLIIVSLVALALLIAACSNAATPAPVAPAAQPTSAVPTEAPTAAQPQAAPATPVPVAEATAPAPASDPITQTASVPASAEAAPSGPPGGFGAPIPAGPCGELQTADFSGVPGAPTSISSTKIVSATATMPEYCDVLGMIAPQIQFELWLPTSTWNERYLQVGCGGYCGSLQPSDQCTTGLAQNFAVGFDNSGHVGGSPMGGGDALFAYNDQQLRADFGYRSEHVMAQAAKAIIDSFYGKAPAHSYYQGCSNGGRQALQEAQTWPEDFDGIIAGAPAAIQAPLNGEYETWKYLSNLDAQGQPILSQNDLTLINNAALANCDGLDGLVDGQITDPRRCTFDPATLLCPTGAVTPTAPLSPTLPMTPGGLPAAPMTGTLPPMGAMTGTLPAETAAAPTCLTPAKVEVLRKLYGGPVDAEGQALYPGHEAVGAELGWSGWIVGFAPGMSPMVDAISNGYLKYLAFPQSPPASYSNRDWQFTAEGFDQLRPMGAVYNATNPDLSAFAQRGGKLILYHGWADPAISPFGTVAYYQAVLDTMGGIDAVQDFARLFMVPGMYHCGGGNAPNTFDMLAPIQDWVEKGAAPDMIRATQTTNGGVSGGFANPTDSTSSGQIVRSRPLCPYPQEQTYKGSGDINDAANFDCQTPTSQDLIDGSYDWIGNDLFRANPPAVTEPILVNPPAGAPGTVFLFTAQGFMPGEQVKVTFEPPAGQSDVTDPAVVVTQGSGDATWTWTAHEGLQAGEYRLVAQGVESKARATAAVTIK